MEDRPYSVFGNALARRMRQKGISGIELANSLKVSANTVVNWKKGVYRPEDKFLRQISTELEMDYNEIVTFISGAQAPLDLLAETLATNGRPQIKKLLQQISIAGLKLSMPRINPTDTSPEKIAKLEEALNDILVIINKIS